MLEGCDARLKNKAGQRARHLAAENGHKPTAKACRRAEKTFRSTSTNQLWAVKLCDFCDERRSELLDQLKLLDHKDTGLLPAAEFLQVDFVLVLPTSESRDDVTARPGF